MQTHLISLFLAVLFGKEGFWNKDFLAFKTQISLDLQAHVPYKAGDFAILIIFDKHFQCDFSPV